MSSGSLSMEQTNEAGVSVDDVILKIPPLTLADTPTRDISTTNEESVNKPAETLPMLADESESCVVNNN